MLFNNTKRFLKHWLLLFLIYESSTTFSNAQSSLQTFWWNDAVFYEVFVRSFKDSNGDGKGDLKGLIDKLDYLNDGDPSTSTDLGVTGLWLMPVQQSPSYHGYDVIDYRTVEEDYGTNEDFKTLVAEAHKRGIKVIIDYVMNHTSSQHPWFQASINPLSNKRNWYVWQDTKPNIKGPWGQDVWYPKNASNYYAIFWSEMPDLNYNTPEVKAEMFDNARFWLEDMNVDGLRLDAALYIIENGNTLQNTAETIKFWQDFRSYYKTVKVDAFAVGEAWTSTNIVQEYVNNKGLDYCFEFDLAAAIVSASNNGDNSGLKSQVDKAMTSYPFLQFGTFLTNHDMNRVMDQLGKNTNKAKVAAELLLTLPGIPYIYYGEEIGMIGSGVDENKRTPLQWNNSSQAGFTTSTPWRAVNADFTEKNIESQKSDSTSLWTKYKNLISIRNNEPALRRGNYKSISSSASSVFSFLRQYEGDNVIVVSNTGSVAASNIQLSLANAGMAPGNYTLVELQGGDQLSLTVANTGGFTNLSINQIPARSTLIYKLAVPTGLTNPIDDNIDIYPIPASKELYIDFSDTFTGTVHYQISDLIGEEKISSSFISSNKGTYSLPCEGLSTGVYLLTLNYNRTSKVFRIVVM